VAPNGASRHWNRNSSGSCPHLCEIISRLLFLYQELPYFNNCGYSFTLNDFFGGVDMELPNYLKSGQVARLFPVITETGKEQKASSIFLAVISAIPELAERLLSQTGQRLGARTSVNTFTEVIFKDENQWGKSDRPDGLIEISTGKRKWTALIEAKIGGNTLDQEQIERYLKLARDNSIDSVITISNEFSALPTHHPLSVSKALTRKVALYHFSWTSILTEAVLMHEQSLVSDLEQAFLLREFIRFFSHSSAGVKGYLSMPEEWSGAIENIQAGGNVQKGEMGQKIVKGWHQELRDLSLLMSRIIGCHVTVKISKAHAGDAERRVGDDLVGLCTKGCLASSFEIPDAASDIQIAADLRSRSLRISMCVDAPKDKKTTKARINWLLRQIKEVDPTGVSIGIIWASRASTTVVSLDELREHPENYGGDRPGVRAFEVILTSNSARRFMGRRTFIEDIEKITPIYYEKIGQHLQSWKALPPKPKYSITNEKDASIEIGKVVEVAQAGNVHHDLLEIPEFLKKLRVSFDR